jgi:hypothetical protein
MRLRATFKGESKVIKKRDRKTITLRETAGPYPFIRVSFLDYTGKTIELEKTYKTIFEFLGDWDNINILHK